MSLTWIFCRHINCNYRYFGGEIQSTWKFYQNRILCQSGIYGPKIVGNAPDHIKIKKNFRTWDRTVLGSRKFSKSRTELDQDQRKFENLGPIWTDSGGPWIPDWTLTVNLSVYNNSIILFFGGKSEQTNYDLFDILKLIFNRFELILLQNV